MSPTEATANGATVITTLGSRSPVPRPWSACRRRTLPRNSCASAGHGRQLQPALGEHPAVLLNNAGASIEATVNKAAPANDAAFAFKTGFSARALIGSSAMMTSASRSARMGRPSSTRSGSTRERPGGTAAPTVLPGLSAAPTPPPAGKASVSARSRAGAPWIDVMRPQARTFRCSRIRGEPDRYVSPSVTTTITTEGMQITSFGTVSHPTLAATNLAASIRRRRLTSAAVVDSWPISAPRAGPAGAAMPQASAAGHSSRGFR